MVETTDPFPFMLLLTGLLAAGGGLAWWLNPSSLSAGFKIVGLKPLSGGRARRVPLMLAVAGALMLLATWGLAWPFAHGSRPYVAVITATASPPLAGLVLVGLVVSVLLDQRR